MDLMKLSSGKV